MPAASCPQCGGPVRVSIAAPGHLACAACRYVGPPHPAVMAELGAAAAILNFGEAARRQLSWAQRRLGFGAAVSSRSLTSLLAVLGLPFAACGGCLTMMEVSEKTFDPVTIVMGWFPVAFLALTGGLVLRQYRAQRARAELDFAAVPPAVPGQPAGCHVCGADLPMVDLSRDAVVRCRYCSADNIVRSDVIARAASLAQSATNTIRAQVERHAHDLARHQRGARASLVLVTLLAPVASFLALMVLAAAEDDEAPQDDLALVDTDKGPCVAARVQYVKTEKGKAQLRISDDNGHAGPVRKKVAVGDYPWFRGEALVGRRVVYWDDGKLVRGTVKRAYRGSLLGNENVDLDVGETRPAKVLVHRVCFDEPPNDLLLLPFEDAD